MALKWAKLPLWTLSPFKSFSCACIACMDGDYSQGGAASFQGGASDPSRPPLNETLWVLRLFIDGYTHEFVCTLVNFMNGFTAEWSWLVCKYTHTCSLQSRDLATCDIVMSFGFCRCIVWVRTVYHVQNVTPMAKYQLGLCRAHTLRAHCTIYNLLLFAIL